MKKTPDKHWNPRKEINTNKKVAKLDAMSEGQDQKSCEAAPKHFQLSSLLKCKSLRLKGTWAASIKFLVGRCIAEVQEVAKDW